MQPSEPDSLKPSVFSSGYLIFRRSVNIQFLLMRHDDRWDLPKGHLDAGETKPQAAIRELHEETGLSPELIWTDPGFVFEHRYWVASRKDPSRKVMKELTIYLGLLLEEEEIECTEHRGFRWWNWCPPHRIQEQTIDPLLATVEKHLLRSVEIRSRLHLAN
ncbi:MAG: NUDIX domain-containing protein [Planctomycetes bacterium]|nr:NUDIX domain-containing protein [Planctomycetota bacterium]